MKRTLAPLAQKRFVKVNYNVTSPVGSAVTNKPSRQALPVWAASNIVTLTAQESNTETFTMAFSLLPKETQYFALFSQLTGKLKEAAAALVEMLSGEDENFESLSKRIKHIEHECDELTHSVTKKLNSSFITPFDREDIYTLSMALDDICDYIDAAGRSVVMYNIHESDQNAKKLAVVIAKL